jgi:hypothetical protein
MFGIQELDYLMQCVDERRTFTHADRLNKGAMLVKIGQLINQAQQSEPEPTKGDEKGPL